MSKNNLFLSWLVVKVALVGLLFVLLGFNYMFSAPIFWYDGSFDLPAARKAINSTRNIDQFDQSGYTALMLAAAAGKGSIVDLLIKKGANVNLAANNLIGDSALHSACRNSNLGTVEVINILLKNNANPLMQNKQKITPFNFIAGVILPEDFKKILNMFISKGVDINYPDDQGRSLLFSVVDRMQIVLLDLLQNDFAYLVDFDLKDKSGKTISQFAIGKGDITKNIKPVFLQGLNSAIDVNSFNQRYSLNKDFTYTMVAAIKGKSNYLKEAIERNGADLNLPDKLLGNTCLHWACLYNWPKCVEVIVENNADTNYKNKVGATPIQCLWGIRDSADKLKVAKLLFDHGSNFNEQDENGNSFLHNAVLWADVNFINLIATDDYFYRRVNFNLKNKSYKTAFEIAQNFIQDPKYKNITDVLRNYNNIFYLTEKDKKSKITPLMLACMRGDDQAAKTIISRSKEAINQKDENSDTPLHFAIRSRSVDIVKLLVKSGAQVNEKNKSGDTPLNEVINIFDKEKREEIVKLLLEKGCEISENKNGENLMHLAVRKKMPDLILFLKQNFGKLEKNKDGKTAYDLAKEIGVKENMKEIISIFEDKK